MFLLPTNVTTRSTKYNFGSCSLDQRIFSSAAGLYLIGFREGNKTKNGATAPFFVLFEYYIFLYEKVYEKQYHVYRYLDYCFVCAHVGEYHHQH